LIVLGIFATSHYGLEDRNDPLACPLVHSRLHIYVADMQVRNDGLNYFESSFLSR
jgi:hypothetical protein